MKLYISPKFNGVDRGYHGGIRRIVDQQIDYFSPVANYDEADIIAVHAGSLVPVRPDQVLISHCHGLYWEKYEWPIGSGAKEANRLVIDSMHMADAITAPTEWVARAIRRGMYAKCTVIGHAVDPEWVPDTRNNKEYVLWNKSRIDKVCDPTPVYRVAHILKDIQFRMTVGAQQSDNITITGLTPYSDKTPVQRAGCYLATAQETFGIGILEALACGIPVCGWNWGGQAEIVTHKVDGYLAEVDDYIDLAEGIQWCLDNRNKIAKNCIKTAGKYTWPDVMKQYEELYEKTLDEKHKRKKISVVIRNYNTGKYLGPAIQSAVAQNTPDTEIVVVDDCSTDDSKGVFDRLVKQHPAYQSVKWVQTPHNSYLSGALNWGIRHTTGEYITLLDADNLLYTNALKTMSEALDKDRNIDIAYGRIKFVQEDGLTPDGRLTGTIDGSSSWPPANFSLDNQLSHKNQIPCTAMIRRKVFERAGPYRARCPVAEDADFWCRATSLGFTPKLVTNNVTFIYRNREGTTSQTVADWPWENWHTKETYPSTYKAHTYEPIVSVIIPVGPGHEHLLQDALDSLQIQTYKNWECIVVNDTGKDLPWLPPWAQEVRTGIYKDPSGPAVARNLGLNMASGKYIVFLDADDYLDADALKYMLTAIIKNGGYVYSDWQYVETGKVIRVPDTCCDTLIEEMPHLITGMYPNIKDIRFDVKIDIGEDWDFTLQMTKEGYCGTRVAVPIVYYRQKSGTRRKEFTNSNARDKLKAKWGGIQMAGCGGCGRNKSMHAYTPPGAPGENNVSYVSGEGPNQQSMTLIEYIGTEPKRHYEGLKTGQLYAFGTLEQHRIKYVWNEDVEGFVSRPDKFRLYSPDMVLSDMEINDSILV